MSTRGAQRLRTIFQDGVSLLECPGMSTFRFRQLAVSLALILGSIVFTVLAVLLADRILGRWIDDPRLTAGLLFPPQVELAVKTYEYSYAIKTNNLGLRDEPYDPRKRPQIVIAAIGDSFTFGQGVQLPEVWIQRVEKNLRDKGLDVEILNFGQPGSAPPHYAKLAEEALSLVKPDLVLVNVLQSNDLETLDPNEPEPEADRRDREMGRALRRWFPNLTDLAYRSRAHQLAERERKSHGRWNLLQDHWKDDFRKTINQFDRFDDSGRFTFLSLPQPLQDAFWNGEIAPLMAFMCSESLRMARQRWWELEVDSPDMQSRIAIVARSLDRIERAVEPWGGRAVVLALPAKDNCDPFGRRNWYKTFGMVEFPPLDDTRADDAIREAARRAGLPSHHITDDFREAASREPLYFPLDSHLTARGNEVYSDLFTPIIEQYVREIADR